MHGWTLLVPRGWAMPFFSSLVFTGSRVGGLREHSVQRFECGSGMAYPEDYVTTQAFYNHSKDKATKERARWERTPPAKRTSYDTLEAAGYRVPNVWNPEWNNLPLTSGASLRASLPDINLLPTQPLPDVPDHENPSEIDPTPRQPWLLRGSNVPPIVEQLCASAYDQAPDILFNEVTRLLRKRGRAEPLSIPPPALFKSALITVNVDLVGRGSPKEFAIIYAFSDEGTCPQLCPEDDEVDTEVW